MASVGDLKREGGAVASSSSYPIKSQAADEPVQTPVTPAGVEYTPRALELLKQWPIVELIIKRGEQAYRSIKQSNAVLNWSLNTSEQVMNIFSQTTVQVFTKLRPLVKLADSAVAEALERVQKYFPLVNESPDKVYKDLKNCVTKRLDPVFHTAASVRDIGKSKLHSATKILIKIHRGLTESVGGWMDRLEKSFNELEAATSKSAKSAPSQQLEDSPPAAADSSVLRLGFNAAAAVGFFYIGAAFWMATRLPVVGSLFAEPPSGVASTSSTKEALPGTVAVPSLASQSEATTSSVEQPAISSGSSHTEQTTTAQ